MCQSHFSDALILLQKDQNNNNIYETIFTRNTTIYNNKTRWVINPYDVKENTSWKRNNVQCETMGPEPDMKQDKEKITNKKLVPGCITNTR